MGDDWSDVYESDRDFIHDAASHGVTLDGKKLPQKRDDEGRVWAVCGCGKKFLMADSEIDSEGS